MRCFYHLDGFGFTFCAGRGSGSGESQASSSLSVKETPDVPTQGKKKAKQRDLVTVYRTGGEMG